MKTIIAASFCVLFVSQVFATDFYVSPAGNDNWSGLQNYPNSEATDGPFKSLERAKLAIRLLKQSHKFNSKVTITLSAGTYYLDSPLNFNVLDSGFVDKPIVWQAERGANVVVSGGAPVPCTKIELSQRWECVVPDKLINSDFFDTSRITGNGPKFDFYVNNQKMVLARWPNQGWAHIKAPLDRNHNLDFSTIEPLPAINAASTGQVHIFPGNDWFDQIVGIDHIDLALNSVNLLTPTNYALDPGRRFYLQNLPELLDSPGEWFYEQSVRKISFLAPQSIEPSKFLVSSLPNLINGQDVSNISFNNISFQHSAGTAINFRNVKSIGLDGVDISNVGGKGLVVKNGVNVVLINSSIHHTGAEGVDIIGGDKKRLVGSGNVIKHNHFHHNGSTLFAHSPAIRMDGVGFLVSNNLLEQGPVTGLILLGNDHVVEKNEIRDFCLEASDCGGFYSGRDWSARGNIVRFNYIHNIVGYGLKELSEDRSQVFYESPAHGVGIYLDDGASGFTIFGNIITNVGFIGIQLGGGRDNKIINNFISSNKYIIFADDRWANYDWSKNQKSLDESSYKNSIWQQHYPDLQGAFLNKTWPEGNIIERNIMISSKDNGNSWRYYLPKGSSTIKNNLIWSVSGRYGVDYKVLETNQKANSAPWQQWVSEGIEKNTEVADPCVKIESKRLVTCQMSLLARVGFESIPSDIGLGNGP